MDRFERNILELEHMLLEKLPNSTKIVVVKKLARAWALTIEEEHRRDENENNSEA